MTDIERRLALTERAEPRQRAMVIPAACSAPPSARTAGTGGSERRRHPAAFSTCCAGRRGSTLSAMSRHPRGPASRDPYGVLVIDETA
jgi:hypothetical protein